MSSQDGGQYALAKRARGTPALGQIIHFAATKQTRNGNFPDAEQAQTHYKYDGCQRDVELRNTEQVSPA